jgi:hypothetical protein
LHSQFHQRVTFAIGASRTATPRGGASTSPFRFPLLPGDVVAPASSQRRRAPPIASVTAFAPCRSNSSRQILIGRDGPSPSESVRRTGENERKDEQKGKAESAGLAFWAPYPPAGPRPSDELTERPNNGNPYGLAQQG